MRTSRLFTDLNETHTERKIREMDHDKKRESKEKPKEEREIARKANKYTKKNIKKGKRVITQTRTRPTKEKKERELTTV